MVIVIACYVLRIKIYLVFDFDINFVFAFKLINHFIFEFCDLDVFLKKFQQPILVEEFVDGRELHVTVLERNGEPWVLPPAEVVFEKRAGWRPILSYEGKWDEKSKEYKMSHMELANLNSNIKNQITDIAKKCYRELGGRDYPRIDMRIRGGEIFVLEINNNPGIDYDIESGIGVSARAAGLSWEDLLKHIVENARRRFK